MSSSGTRATALDVDWESEYEKILKRRANGETWDAIALDYNILGDSLRRGIARVGRTYAPLAAREINRAAGIVLDVPVRPLAIALPKPAEIVKSDELFQVVVYGDTHFPFHDQRCINVVLKIIEQTQPRYIIHVGDALDAYPISKYDKSIERKHTLQDEVNMVREHFAQVRLASPSSTVLWLEGNHEDRLTRLLHSLQGPARALLDLDVVRKSLTWPVIVGTEELGIEFVPRAEQSQRKLLPKFIIKHGDKIRPESAQAARAEWEQYGRSGASGHTHKLGSYFHRDHNGNHVWTETGCCCKLSGQEYIVDPDWHQGCVEFTFEPRSGAVQVEPVKIHNGMAVFRQQILRA
jgi:predicted phosphodiesterase